MLFIMVVFGANCNVNLSPKKERLFVVEEKKINDKNTFFWFRGTGQITHNEISYFQITNDRCKLSIKNADAYCNDPVQIDNIKNDTIFILSISEIVPIKANKHFKIQMVPYSIELYDTNKKPDRAKQYFLDSLCKK